MKKQQKGFTLIELMIVVAIIGILAAIAIPAFLEYMNSGKGTEAELNLNKLAKSAKIYRQKNGTYPSASEGPIPGDGTQAGGSCAVPTGAYTSGTFLPTRTAGGPFELLDFTIGDGFRYDYEWVGDGGAGTAFTAQALGDLDCDGTTKSTQAIGTIDASGNPMVQFTSSGTD